VHVDVSYSFHFFFFAAEGKGKGGDWEGEKKKRGMPKVGVHPSYSPFSFWPGSPGKRRGEDLRRKRRGGGEGKVSSIMTGQAFYAPLPLCPFLLSSRNSSRGKKGKILCEEEERDVAPSIFFSFSIVSRVVKQGGKEERRSRREKKKREAPVENFPIFHFIFSLPWMSKEREERRREQGRGKEESKTGHLLFLFLHVPAGQKKRGGKGSLTRWEEKKERGEGSSTRCAASLLSCSCRVFRLVGSYRRGKGSKGRGKKKKKQYSATIGSLPSRAARRQERETSKGKGGGKGGGSGVHLSQHTTPIKY